MKAAASAVAVLLAVASGWANPSTAQAQTNEPGINAVYSGIGVTIQETKKKIQIIDVRADGPAAKAGVLAGEYIRAVDAQAVDGMTVDQVAELVRGEPGTEVKLTLSDENGDHLHDLAVQRELLEIQCLLEGAVNLTLSGSNIFGTIGGQSISWFVANGYVQSSIGGKPVSLQVQQELGTSNFLLTGWINNTSINWYSIGNYWNTYQSCIPN